MAIQDFCGLDFGTSNSTIGICKGDETLMVPLEQGRPVIRSALFFDYDAEKCFFGQQGINDYLSGGHGRLMMSLKSMLGSALMREHTLINGKRIAYTQILGYFIGFLKQQAEQTLGREISQAVMGRPVRFHDSDLKRDRLAQDTLEQVAKSQGFKNIVFQYEPIAAALAYEQSIDREKLALIVDLGGGTSDFSIIRLRPGMYTQDRFEDVLANQGIHIGGTDFDTRFSLKVVMPTLGLGGMMRGTSAAIQIPNSVYYDLTTWHTIHSLYTHKTRRNLIDIRNLAFEQKPIERLLKVLETQQGHKILYEIEQGKCALSQETEVSLDLNFIESGFEKIVQRTLFEESIQEKVEQLIQTLLETVQTAGVTPDQIDSVFFTGGSTQIPIIRQRIAQCFPKAEWVQGDVFSSVGKGLIIDAKRRFSIQP